MVVLVVLDPDTKALDYLLQVMSLVLYHPGYEALNYLLQALDSSRG